MASIQDCTRTVHVLSSRLSETAEKLNDMKADYASKEKEIKQRNTKIQELKTSIAIIQNEIEESKSDLENIQVIYFLFENINYRSAWITIWQPLDSLAFWIELFKEAESKCREEDSELRKRVGEITSEEYDLRSDFSKQKNELNRKAH